MNKEFLLVLKKTLESYRSELLLSLSFKAVNLHEIMDCLDPDDQFDTAKFREYADNLKAKTERTFKSQMALFLLEIEEELIDLDLEEEEPPSDTPEVIATELESNSDDSSSSFLTALQNELEENKDAMSSKRNTDLDLLPQEESMTLEDLENIESTSLQNVWKKANKNPELINSDDKFIASQLHRVHITPKLFKLILSTK